MAGWGSWLNTSDGWPFGRWKLTGKQRPKSLGLWRTSGPQFVWRTRWVWEMFSWKTKKPVQAYELNTQTKPRSQGTKQIPHYCYSKVLNSKTNLGIYYFWHFKQAETMSGHCIMWIKEWPKHRHTPRRQYFVLQWTFYILQMLYPTDHWKMEGVEAGTSLCKQEQHLACHLRRT